MSKPYTDLRDLHVDYLTILSTESETHKTDRMAYVVLKALKQLPGVSWKLDAYGNIYAEKGKGPYAAYVCHIDTVHPFQDFYKVFEHQDRLFAMAINRTGEPVPAGIGADDKCGVIGCLELLTVLKNVKCAFFLDEERGCLGSEKGDLTFFQDCRFAIQIDRRNGGDIITNGGGTELCSKEFIAHISEVGAKFGYKPTTGLTTDVVALKKKGLNISAVNLSCGYYNPHGKNEFIYIPEFLNCLQFCRALAAFKNVFPHILPKPAPVVHRGGYTAPARGAKSGAQTQMFCEECGKKLTGSESYDGMHEECMAELYERYTRELPKLDLSNPAEPKIIVEGADEDDETLSPFPKLPDTNTLPTRSCLLCQIELFQQADQNRGYCEPCGYCSCGSIYPTTAELLARMCEKCISALAKPSGGAVQHAGITNVCPTPTCYNQLVNERERLEQLCDECYADANVITGH